ncbi:ATP-binding cassette domain-containing protein [Asanoa sp. WMMD1127]|uniref:methionine ABC transporter ATP-binding protein n=1 Tax=Asanoa sp. WMMD1127 TaxID=3016107 RepID=UPI002417E497|nr:ATP-binding cassette domain-containing protein [Asanoa sp. WMMD1127]MDG4822947.1 ATP-binding cassette domain-containing protein [Asanoa sp. WMMD1127]
MIRIDGLRKTYRGRGGEVAAVAGVDLTVRAGEVFGVLGRSGAGKSTLLRCVNMLERPDAGTVTVDGVDLGALNETGLRAARQRIGMIHQHFALLSSRTAAGNVAFPLEVMGVPRRERAARVAELLDLVGLRDRTDAYPAQLSGGQKQRVGIARALAGEPKVLLSDEATSALDPETTGSILALLRDLNQRLGLTILLITHEMEVVKRICDSVAIMSDGRITEAGPVHELLARPDSALARGIFRLGPPPDLPGATVVDLTVVGDGTLLSDVARAHDVDVRLLDGAVETLAGGRAGRLRIALPGPPSANEAAVRQLRAGAVAVEVHP